MKFDIKHLKDLANKLDYKPDSQQYIDNLSNYCSSDRVRAICEAYAALEARVKVLGVENLALRESLDAAEAELERLKTQEPVGWLVGLPGLYPTFTMDYRNVEQATNAGGYKVMPVYAEPRPAVLPPEKKWEEPEDGVDVDYMSGSDAYTYGELKGYNQAIADAKALGCQPQRFVVKRPGTKCIGWVKEAIHEHDEQWFAEVKAAGGETAE